MPKEKLWIVYDYRLPSDLKKKDSTGRFVIYRTDPVVTRVEDDSKKEFFFLRKEHKNWYYWTNDLEDASVFYKHDAQILCKKHYGLGCDFHPRFRYG